MRKDDALEDEDFRSFEMPMYREGMHYRWFERDEEEETRIRAAQAAKRERSVRRAVRTGLTLSIGAFGYGAYAGDIPVAFLSMSFLMLLAAPTFRRFPAPWGNRIANGAEGFAAGLFFGAFILLFF